MSLFDDEDEGNWSIPNPRAPAATDKVQSLLADATIPHSYTAAFESTHPIGGFATAAALETTLKESGITERQRDKVKQCVVGGGNSISRGAWNAAMCLIALAQSGEQDLDLDSVDNVKDNLPEVKLAQGAQFSSSPDVSWAQRPPEFDDDDDASQVAMPNNNGDHHEHNTTHNTAIQHEPWRSRSSDPEEYNPIANDTITIKVLPEKEGMFMFRHVVYVLEGVIPGQNQRFKVVRRYSDFLWLLECLVKIYPFRLLPVLPPKRLAVDGRYLSSDSYFLERRRRGLTRFVNQMVKHPLLRREKLVQMFLTVDTELSVWRKQTSLKVEEEFAYRVISQQFIQHWDEEPFQKHLKQMRQGAEDALEVTTQLVYLFDRVCKRQEAMSQDYQKISTAFGSLKAPVAEVYKGEDIATIKEGLSSVSRFTSNTTALYQDESRSIDIGSLEEVKQLRGLVSSITELFHRLDKHGGNNIKQLEQRIEMNERKLKTLTARDDAKATEMDKLSSAINRDKKSIQFQTNRDWLIKECLTEELELCQRTQYQISRLAREWAADQVKYSELQQENWAEMNNEVANLPLI